MIHRRDNGDDDDDDDADDAISFRGSVRQRLEFDFFRNRNERGGGTDTKNEEKTMKQQLKASSSSRSLADQTPPIGRQRSNSSPQKISSREIAASEAINIDSGRNLSSWIAYASSPRSLSSGPSLRDYLDGEEEEEDSLLSEDGSSIESSRPWSGLMRRRSQARTTTSLQSAISRSSSSSSSSLPAVGKKKKKKMSSTTTQAASSAGPENQRKTPPQPSPLALRLRIETLVEFLFAPEEVGWLGGTGGGDTQRQPVASLMLSQRSSNAIDRHAAHLAKNIDELAATLAVLSGSLLARGSRGGSSFKKVSPNTALRAVRVEAAADRLDQIDFAKGFSAGLAAIHSLMSRCDCCCLICQCCSSIYTCCCLYYYYCADIDEV